MQVPGAKASRVVGENAPPDASVGQIVHLDRDGQTKGGVATIVPAPARFQDQIRAYGSVLAIDRLTTLYNASLTSAAQLHAAEARASASRAANDRAQNLLKVFPTAKAQAEAAEASYDIDRVGVEAAGAQIDALRNSAIQEWGPVLGPSIVSRAAIAQALVLRKNCLVQVSVPAGGAITPPRHVVFLLGTATSVDGSFVSEATQADPKMQTAGYFYSVPMSPGLLPGASVVAYLPKGDAKPGVGIPSSAVVWQSGRAWLYVRIAPDTFERRPIDDAGAVLADGGYIVPATSLPRDQAIVVVGAQILLSEESRAQIPSDGDDN